MPLSHTVRLSSLSTKKRSERAILTRLDCLKRELVQYMNTLSTNDGHMGWITQVHRGLYQYSRDGESSQKSGNCPKIAETFCAFDYLHASWEGSPESGCLLIRYLKDAEHYNTTETWRPIYLSWLDGQWVSVQESVINQKNNQVKKARLYNWIIESIQSD